MSDDPEKLVLLTIAGGSVEASLIYASLEGAGISVVLYGRTTADIGTRLGTMFGVEVCVAARDVEAARALLSEAQPVSEGPVCPVHKRPATASCDCCGTFLCPECSPFGDPPLCEDCVAHEDHALARRPALARKAIAALLLALAAALVGRLLGWSR